MAADDLRRDRATERKTVEYGWKMLRPDPIVKLRCRDAVGEHTGVRRPARAFPEATVVEEEDVQSRIEKMRNHVGADGQVAGVAVAEDATGQRLFRAAVPRVQRLAVGSRDRVFLDCSDRNSVVGRIPALQRLALGSEDLRLTIE